MVMRRAAALALFILLPASAFLACRPAPAFKGLTLVVSFASRTLTDDLFTDMTFRFRTDASFTPPAGAHRVVAEFSSHGRLVFRIAFRPPRAVETWTSGKEYVFTRRIYIPAFIDEFSPSFRGTENLYVAAGLVGPEREEVPMRTALLRRRVRVAPAPDTPVVVYGSGWYAPETGPGYTLGLTPLAELAGPPTEAETGSRPLLRTIFRPGRRKAKPNAASRQAQGPSPALSAPEPESGSETVFPPVLWRWTAREATCFIDNPGRDALLVICGSVETEYASGQILAVRIGDRLLDEFTPAGGDFDRSYVVEKGWLEGRRDFALTLTAAKTFIPARAVPGSADTHELGVRIAVVYFR